MDINSGNFWPMLPSILEAARTARYVAMDLEMTGISTTSEPFPPNISVQDAYTRVKTAAESFQVLQVGLTFYKYNVVTAEYHTQTFNFSLSPMFPKSSSSRPLTQCLYRKFAISTSSYEFLVDHKFDLANALDLGVPYLSRDEEQRAKHYLSTTRQVDADVNVAALDGASQEFYKSCREQLRSLVNRAVNGEVAIQWGNFYNTSNLQILMVRQLVRDEFPHCMVRKYRFQDVHHCLVRVADDNDRAKEKEKEHASIQRSLVEVDKCSGLRLVFEAISGGEFAFKIQREWIKHEGVLQAFNGHYDLHRCEEQLQRERPVLVGHNLFHDLVFIYHTLFGKPPDSVDHFLNRIHELFPRIVDTKYLFTRTRTQMDADRPLDQVYSAARVHQFPTVKEIEGYGYNEAKSHQAGYDSFMTANVHIKLCYLLYSRHEHLKLKEEVTYQPGPDRNAKGKAASKRDTSAGRGYDPNRSLLDDDARPLTEATDRDPLWYLPPLIPSRRADTKKPDPEAASARPSAKLPVEANVSLNEVHLLPLWTDPFWSVYGNKTRLAGTVVSFV